MIKRFFLRIEQAIDWILFGNPIIDFLFMASILVPFRLLATKKYKTQLIDDLVSRKEVHLVKLLNSWGIVRYESCKTK